MERYYSWILAALLLGSWACSGDAPKSPVAAASPQNRAEALIDSAIAAHGGQRYERMYVSFHFRGTPFTVRQEGGRFTYTQQRIDSGGDTIVYTLDNEGLHKSVNGQPSEEWAAKEKAKYGETTNAVVYFALLPFGLQSPAVEATYVDSVTIQGNPYHKIRVTFRKEGGGEDYQDVFLYWIHAQSHTVDYLAYAYQTNGGGMRFRKTYRVKVVNGIRFQDYINYKPTSPTAALNDLDSLFAAGALKQVSRIDLDSIEVQLLPPA